MSETAAKRMKEEKQETRKRTNSSLFRNGHADRTTKHLYFILFIVLSIRLTCSITGLRLFFSCPIKSTAATKTSTSVLFPCFQTPLTGRRRRVARWHFGAAACGPSRRESPRALRLLEARPQTAPRFSPGVNTAKKKKKKKKEEY